MPRTSLLFLLVTLGCGHSEPLTPRDYGTDQPFQPGPPPRLTANTGEDDEISFTPDGSELIYSVSRSCLAFLPAHQARGREWLCPPEEPGVSDRYRQAALSPSGRLAWVLTRQRPHEAGPFYKAVLVAPLADLRDSSEITPVPFVTVVDGILHREISRITWLRGDTLAILADGIVYLTHPRDTVRPRPYLRLPLPGSAYSIQSGKSGSVLYLRLAGDSRVLAWRLATQTLAQVYDFANIPAGVVALGTRHLAAAIPGAVLRIDLSGNRIDTTPALNLAIMELAMTPDGSDIIASAVVTGPPPVPGTSDLYRVGH